MDGDSESQTRPESRERVVKHLDKMLAKYRPNGCTARRDNTGL